jgi:hypothetical protein
MKYYPGIFLDGPSKTTTTLRLFDGQAETRNRHLTSTNLNRYVDTVSVINTL